ncbi:MAG: hypothetical protein U0935_16705 [Pirellulales bacterium]
MWKHLVLGVVIALIISVCGSAEARLLGRRGGCPGGKCGAVAPAKSAAVTPAANAQAAANR